MRAVKFGKKMAEEYKDDDVSDLAASLAYYATFSIVPMLLLVIAIGGMFFGEGATQERVMTELRNLMGASGAQFVETALSNSNQLSPGKNILASLIGLGLVLALPERDRVAVRALGG